MSFHLSMGVFWADLNPARGYLSKDESGLPRDSIVMAHQIGAIAKDRLVEKCGELTSDEIKAKISA
ncbi:MAG: type II toxin-antitoxin system PemK/MazF family toxin [Bacillota bacterium]